MTSFGWKRKSGESVKKQSEAGWTEDSKEEEARPPAEKKAREESKFQQICRLKEEGIRHAEREEFWHSVSKFDDATQLIRGLTLGNLLVEAMHAASIYIWRLICSY